MVVKRVSIEPFQKLTDQWEYDYPSIIAVKKLPKWFFAGRKAGSAKLTQATNATSFPLHFTAME